MSVRLALLRLALVVAMLACLAQTGIVHEHNGATVLGLALLVALLATSRRLRGFVRHLLGHPCLDCLDGRHMACEGCSCTEIQEHDEVTAGLAETHGERRARAARAEGRTWLSEVAS